MRILHVTEYITIDGVKPFERNRTGFGYLVASIAKSQVALSNDVTVYNIYSFADEYNYCGVRILNRSKLDCFKKLSFLTDINYLLCFLRLFKPRFTELFSVIFSCLNRSSFRKEILTGNYDIIHFHSVTIFSYPLLELVASKGLNFCVTLHGLNSFGHLHDRECNYRLERLFLWKAINLSWNVTLISSGIKKRIEKHFDRTVNFEVILNGVIECEKNLLHTNIPDQIFSSDRKIGLYLANISERKNQRYLISKFHQIPSQIREKVIILHAGEPSTEFSITELIEESGFIDQLFYVGYLSRSEVNVLLERVDFTILLSEDEGFGLSLIEGFAHGKPAMIFDDMDVANDILNIESSVSVSRSLEGLIEGLEQIVSNSWNKESIINFGKKFSMSNVASLYLNYYKEILL
jgi:glycosyltransferase involved in cell wall biosynthesis